MSPIATSGASAALGRGIQNAPGQRRIAVMIQSDFSNEIRRFAGADLVEFGFDHWLHKNPELLCVVHEQPNLAGLQTFVALDW